MSVRYANGLGEQLRLHGHELAIVYRHPYQLDLVGSLAGGSKLIRLSTAINFINNRTLNRAGVELLFSPTSRISRVGADFRVVTTDLYGVESRRLGSSQRRPNGDLVVVGSVGESRYLLDSRIVKSQPTTIYPSTSVNPDDTTVLGEPPSKTILYGGRWLGTRQIAILAEAFGVLRDFELVVTPKLGDSAVRRLGSVFEEAGARVRFAQLESTSGLQSLITSSFAVVQTEVSDLHGLIPADVLALGIPLVVSDEPIMQELVGPTGTFFDPQDALSLASRVRELQRHGAWVRASGTARRKAKQLTWASSYQKLERLIQQLLAK